MGRLDQKKKQHKQDSGDKPHQRPLRTADQEDVDHQSEAKMTPGPSLGEIPRHKEKVDGGKRQQIPLQKRENVDGLQSEATVTPGAFSIDSVNPPYGNDDPFDNIQQPLDQSLTSSFRDKLTTQPSATQIVAHLADDADIEARIAERLQKEIRETLEQERLGQPSDDVIIVATKMKDEENVSVCGLQKRTVWSLICLSLLGIGGIVGGVVYRLGNDDTVATPQLDPLLQELKPWIAPTEDDLLPFNEFSSPQSRALAWLKVDPITMSTGRDVSIVLERYVPAVIYFSTIGSGWDDRYNFLSDADVCTWNNGKDRANGGRGVFCSTDDKTIDYVNLRENNLQTTLPWELFLLTTLKFIDMSTNKVEGTIPTRIDELTRLEHFDLSNNNSVRGALPTTLSSKMTTLILFNNALTGTIPSSWGASMPKLRTLDLDFNQLTGPLPTTLSSTMTGLDMTNNALTGTIPSSWGAGMPDLVGLSLSFNQLTGPLPETMPSTMNYIYLSNNALTGTIPSSWVASMPKLDKLILSYHQLTGPLPVTMPSTMKYLDLSSNSLTGTIPSSWGAGMPELTFLDLFPNQLTGTIPSDLRRFNIM
jgi:hypothetical protein